VEDQKRLLMSGKTSENIVAHPVDAYLLVRRLTADWEDVHMALHGISNYSQGKNKETFHFHSTSPEIPSSMSASSAFTLLFTLY